jgi:hypothetical protein
MERFIQRQRKRSREPESIDHTSGTVDYQVGRSLQRDHHEVAVGGRRHSIEEACAASRPSATRIALPRKFSTDPRSDTSRTVQLRETVEKASERNAREDAVIACGEPRNHCYSRTAEIDDSTSCKPKDPETQATKYPGKLFMQEYAINDGREEQGPLNKQPDVATQGSCTGDPEALPLKTPAATRVRSLLPIDQDPQDEVDDGASVEQASQCIVWNSASRRVCRVSPGVGSRTLTRTTLETEKTPHENLRRRASSECPEVSGQGRGTNADGTPVSAEGFSPDSQTFEIWRRLRSRRRSSGLENTPVATTISPKTPFTEVRRRLVQRASRAVTVLLEGNQPGVNAPTETRLTCIDTLDAAHAYNLEVEDEAMLDLFQLYTERSTESTGQLRSKVGPREAASPRLTVVSVDRSCAANAKPSRTLLVRPCGAGDHFGTSVSDPEPRTHPSASFIVVLQDSWSELNVQQGDTIRLVRCTAAGEYAPFQARCSGAAAQNDVPGHPFIVSAEENLCILHPDVLVSGTSVANAFSCLRRVVLGERNRYSIHQPRTTRAALRGTLLHQLFQQLLWCCIHSAETKPTVSEEDLCQLVRRYYAELYALGESEDELLSYLRESVPDLALHVQHLCCEQHGVHLQVRGQCNLSGVDSMRIQKLYDIEESIWSPIFGLKGSIDVTVAAELLDRDRSGQTLPITCLELKTGRQEGFSGIAHRAQLILYALLLSERYGTSVQATILLYLQNNQTGSNCGAGSRLAHREHGQLTMSLHLIPMVRAELIGILMTRNKLAHYLRFRRASASAAEQEDPLDAVGRSWLHLPPPLQHQENLCSFCYVRDACALYHRVIDSGEAHSSAIPAVFREMADGLSNQHVAYYRHWLAITRLEEEAAVANREEVWLLSPTERSQLGRCVGELELVQVEKTNGLGTGRFVDCYRHRFRIVVESASDKCGGSTASPAWRQCPESDDLHLEAMQGARWDLLTGDYVLVSLYWRRPPRALPDGGDVSAAPSADVWDPLRQETAIAGGFVAQVQPLTGEIEIDLERDCSKWLQRHPLVECIPASTVRWRVDREELSAGFSTMYGNLEALLYPEAERLRRLVIDLEAPRFTLSPGAEHSQCPSSSALLHMERFAADLNEDQKRAIERVLRSQDYVLLLGMPGTGKTATVACLVALLVDAGCSVLLASHTHSAVDNVLRRLVEHNVHKFVRLGNRTHVDPQLWPYMLCTEQMPDTSAEPAPSPLLPSLDAFSARFEEAAIVATTCLGASHPVFYRRRMFDYVIVDEASQIAQPVVLGPLRFAQKAFVLVGDDKQLPPLARDPLAQAQGADESLFTRLCAAHPEAVVVLHRQYRMAADIMLLSNALVYNGSLVCGDQATAEQHLTNRQQGLRSVSPTPDWLVHVLDPRKRVLFLNTDAAQDRAREFRCGQESICNYFEASIIVRIVEALDDMGIERQHIGITSPLRAQVSLIQNQFHQGQRIRNAGTLPECRTIDQFQGRDKDVLLVSLVRSNSNARIGQVLRDWRRLNVAMTRARCKLVFVGSAQTMQTSPFVARLITLIQDVLHGLVPVTRLN